LSKQSALETIGDSFDRRKTVLDLHLKREDVGRDAPSRYRREIERLQRARAAGATHKIWTSESNANTRTSHRAANQQRVGIDGRFKIGSERLFLPSETRGGIHEWANCRCNVRYVMRAFSRDTPIDPDTARPKPRGKKPLFDWLIELMRTVGFWQLDQHNLRFLKHYFFGNGEPLDLQDIDLLDTVRNRSAVKKATYEFEATVINDLKNKAQTLRKTAQPGARRTYKINEHDVVLRKLTVGAFGLDWRLFSLGNTALAAKGTRLGCNNRGAHMLFSRALLANLKHRSNNLSCNAP